MSRILIIVENLPVPLDRRVWQEACALRDAGHHVTVICPQMHGYDTAEEVLDGITIYRHWISGEGNGILGFLSEYSTALWGEFRYALKAWRRGGFDAVHLCNPPDLLFLVAAPFKMLAGVRVLYDVHDLWPEMYEAKFGGRNLFYWAVRLAERCTLALADRVVATNESVRATAMRRGNKKPDEVTVVRTAPNALDTTTPPDPTLKRGKKYLVGYIGVMGDADGVDYLVRAAHYLVHERGRKDIQFLLMGGGPEHQALLKLREELGLSDYLEMPGRVSNAFLFTAFQTMDIGVACDPINDYNNHCTMNKTLEYMAFGKAQVMFGTTEGRHSAGEAALYVNENCPKKLGDGIVELLEDEPRRLRMGELGKQRLATELSWQRSVEQLTATYSKLLDS